jgi:hypothetical protein
MKLFGIAYTNNGCRPPIGKVTHWMKNSDGDIVWDKYRAALEALDNDGWKGFVCYYPSGEWAKSEIKDYIKETYT